MPRGWLGGVVVESRTRNRQIVGSIPVRGIIGQRPWASCSHQCASVYQAV